MNAMAGFRHDDNLTQLRVPPHSIESEQAVLGGLILGLVESIGAGYLGDWTGGFLGSHYVDILSFGILIVVLVFKPSGLLGERVADRA